MGGASTITDLYIDWIAFSLNFSLSFGCWQLAMFNCHMTCHVHTIMSHDSLVCHMSCHYHHYVTWLATPSTDYPFLHHRRSSSNFSAGRLDFRHSSQDSQTTDDTMSDVGSFASEGGVRCGGGSTGCASVDRAILQHLIHCDCLLQVCTMKNWWFN